MYYRWRHFLPESMQLVPILLPGREGRFSEPACDNLNDVVEGILPALADKLGMLMPDQGWILFGHSMGALIAFEVARLAHRCGLPAPALLLASSCVAPQMLPPRESLHLLSDTELLARLVERYGLTGPDAESEQQLMRLMLPTLRADLRMFETYRFEASPPLAMPIVAMGGADDPQVTRHDLQHWRERTSSTFRTRVFPGGHFYLRAHERSVAEFVGRTAQNAIGRSSPDAEVG